VKIVGARAGVEATTHALRAAFAVQFDEEHPDQLIALKELMHARIDTTLVYLRRKDKARAMETVHSLSWGRFVFPPQRKLHTEKSPNTGTFRRRRIRGSNPCYRRERAAS
jgi:hypothetical protein